jgi:hypothetical protein
MTRETAEKQQRRLEYERLKQIDGELNSHPPYSFILYDVSVNYFRNYEELKKEFDNH